LWGECELSDDSVVRVALTWHSSGTGLRGNGSSEDLSLNYDSREVLLQTDIRGEDLAQALNLEMGLILLRPGSQSGRLAARRPGSNLWSQARRLVLEGQASRFPVELKDFGQTGWLQPAAGWYLDWTYDDLEAPLLADLRLFVNSSNRAVKDAVTGRGDPRQGAAIQQTIYFDVARTLIEGALDNDRFVAAPEKFEDGTVGAAVRRLIATLFSGQDITVVAEIYHRNRFRFEVDLQHRLRVFETLS
jgi:hypothetical protein